MQTEYSCVFCQDEGGAVFYRDDYCRVVLTEEPFAGFCRLIWNAHVVEMSDLDEIGRNHCFRVLIAVEQVLREVLQPAKINLACFGNVVPHLHWHIIPRFSDDSHFPESVWGQARRPGVKRSSPDVILLGERLTARLRDQKEQGEK